MTRYGICDRHKMDVTENENGEWIHDEETLLPNSVCDSTTIAVRKYMGIQAVVDITGRNPEELFDAIENLLCGKEGHPNSEEPCDVESLATTTHEDLDKVSAWVTGDEVEW